MEARGGGFASYLAKAAWRADDVNFEKIKGTFSEIWERHLEMINNEQKVSE
jgi:hypothetical protein